MKKSVLKKNQGAYTLVEIMLVLAIISVLVGSAIYLLANNVDMAKEQRVETDFQAISTQLKMYEMRNYNVPTTEQGLDGAASDNCWRLSETDLVCLAGQFGLCVTKAWLGIYKVARCEMIL